MLTSYEIRWLFDGELPLNMLHWMESFNPEKQSPRTDYYFHQTENGSLGIKLREGSLQLKPKLKSLGQYTFQTHSGYKEKFHKWSYAIENNSEWSEMVERPGVWVPVTKSREMVKYTFEGGYPDQVEMDEDIEKGCEVELSSISIREKDFWSLAFEAYGKDGHLTLDQSLRHIFETSMPPEIMSEKNSFGYAHLIHDIQT